MQKNLVCILLLIGLSGCNLFPDEKEIRLQSAKAIGAACNQAGRSIEECFELHPKTLKIGIVDGWKEMNLYMKQNNLTPQVKKNEPTSSEQTVKENNISN